MNKKMSIARALSLGLAVAVVVAAGLVARGWVADWTRGQLRDRHVRRIRLLDDQRAATAARRMVQLDADAPSVLAPLLLDERPAVAAAAAEAIDRLVADWGRLPAEESSPRIAALAGELARAAPQLASDERRWLHAVATRLVLWPLVGDVAARGQVLADCEAILQLPLPTEPAIRVAAAVRGIEPHEAELVEAPALLPDLPGTLPAAAPAAEDPPWPRVYGPVEPGRMIDASREQPSVPKQFLPPRAMKIEG